MTKMGRLNPQLTHFSHPHPLELTDNLSPNLHQSVCWGCRIGILPGRPYYSCKCKTCGFCLHSTCFKLPRKISHPGDPNHVLVLLMSPSFDCKACGKPGGGLCFSCKQCNHDYHSLCTLKPLSTTSPMHHRHPLCLEFKPPYGGQGFRCDLCGNHWFYSCAECGFDVHLDCPTAKAPAESTTVLNVGPGNHAGFHPNGSYGPNQAVLQPNRGIGYSDRAMSGGSQGGMMSGLMAGAIVTGIGSGSMHDTSSNGVSDIINCWVGGDFF